MDNRAYFLYLLTMAGVTYLIRAVPLAAIQGRIRSRFVQSFLHYVPYAVLGAMTFPAVLGSTPSMAGSLCGLAAALILGWMGKGLLTVAVAACACAYLGQLLL
ncbi:MAG: AzlD domain-containing protein [Candidatus Limiplasma sp.]|nr:AzlD domain-containing protein [Candidatus Limiplasma sp.]